jgi:hypothetical protein
MSSLRIEMNMKTQLSRFVEKKRRKKLSVPAGFGTGGAKAVWKQKFFASFFQKRSASLLALSLLAHPAAAQTLRPAVGRPLQQAENLIRVQNYNAALAKIQQAAAVHGLSTDESLTIAELRGEAEAGAGDYGAAAGAYRQALATGAVPAAEQLTLVQAIAGFYDRAGDNADAITWLNRYIAGGGQDSGTRALLAQVYYQSGDFSGADKAAAADIAHDRAAGQKPPAAEWQILASAAQKSGDAQGYQTALFGLLAHDPSPAYWAAAINALVATPGFPDRLTLDVYRLRRATGTLSAPGAYEDYTERAILAGRKAEAKAVLAEGFESHILTTATDAGHASRLQTLLAADQVDTAPQTALDQAIAAFEAGNTQAAIAGFNQVAGQAPSPDAALARLWAIRAASGPAPAG